MAIVWLILDYSVGCGGNSICAVITTVRR
jgi:hypothetical protein